MSFAFLLLSTTLKCCFRLETYLSLKGSNEFWIKRRIIYGCVCVCHLNGYCCGGGTDGGSNKKSNVARARSTWKCSFAAANHSEQEMKQNKMFWFFSFQFSIFRCGVSASKRNFDVLLENLFLNFVRSSAIREKCIIQISLLIFLFCFYVSSLDFSVFFYIVAISFESRDSPNTLRSENNGFRCSNEK